MLARWLPLSKAEKRVLAGLFQGAVLKAHRYLDGTKVHKLYFAETNREDVINERVINSLWQRGLISSNMKFPAATYMLTAAGRRYIPHTGTT